jgi:hypothetical protein
MYQVNSYSINGFNFNFNSLLYLSMRLLKRRKTNYKIGTRKDANIETHTHTNKDKTMYLILFRQK